LLSSQVHQLQTSVEGRSGAHGPLTLSSSYTLIEGNLFTVATLTGTIESNQLIIATDETNINNLRTTVSGTLVVSGSVKIQGQTTVTGTLMVRSNGTGTSATDHSLRLMQNLRFSGSNPTADTTGFVNMITPTNIIKAWGGQVYLGGSAPVLGGNQGFNISSCAYTDIGGSITVLDVTLGSSLASLSGSVFVVKNTVSALNNLEFYGTIVNSTRSGTYPRIRFNCCRRNCWFGNADFIHGTCSTIRINTNGKV